MSRFRSFRTETAIKDEAMTAMETHRVLRPRGHYLVGHEEDGEEIHSEDWVEPRHLVRDPEALIQIVQSLIDIIPNQEDIQVMVGPGYAGFSAFFLANMLSSQMTKVQFAPIVEYSSHFASQVQEKEDDEQSQLYMPPFFRKQVVKGRRVCLIDDVMFTGRHLHDAYNLVTEVGGIVVCKAVIYDRGHLEERYQTPGEVYSLGKVRSTPPLRASKCTLCKANIPLTRPYDEADELLEVFPPSGASE